MRYQWRDLPAVLRTPIGRSQLQDGFYHWLWPARSRLACLYRRTLLARTRLIAVSGSFGKTTTTRALTAALGQPLPKGVSLNDKSWLPGMVFRVRPGMRHAAIETGIDHKGQMSRLADILRPSIAVMTVVGSEHNRSLPTLEATREEKVCLVRALPASGVAVLNGDDPNVRWMATQTEARVVTYGFDASNQVRAVDASLDWPRGSRLRVSIGQAILELRVRTVGRHQMYPYLATLAALHAEGLPLKPAIQRLEELPATPGAMEIRPLDNGAIMLCDYSKSGFETIVAALDVLAEVPARRRIVALGSVTEPPRQRDRLYLELGERVGRLACRVVILGHDFSKYWRGIRRTNIPREAVLEASGDILAAARFVAGDLRPGDVVLIKGRGNQRMERIAMMLEGQKVRCELPVCRASSIRCDTCSMLDRGWDGLRPVF